MKTVVYVSNADSGSMSVLALDETSGTLATLQTAAVGGMVMPLALAPGHRRLFAARRSEPYAAISFDIDVHDGTLTRLGEGPLPQSMAYVACDRGGGYLFSASYGGNLVAVSPIGVGGIVGAARKVLPTGPNAHAIRADASNRFVFSTALGAGVVMQWRFDPGSGALTPNDPATLPIRAGAGPRHLERHPNGQIAFLLNELDASIDVLTLDAGHGTLQPRQTVSALPPGFASGEPWAADIHLSPDARFLYASERRSSTLAAFRVDTTGHLTPIGHVAAQTQPRGFAITPSGRWLVVAGQLSHRVGVHAIDSDTGALTLADEHDVGQNPNWVEIVALP